MNFWLERGACGYRMDVINMISKVQSFPDAEPVLGPDAKYHPGGKYFVNGPRMHEFLQEINRKVLIPRKAITVGEMPGVSDINEVIRSVGAKSGELNMIFIFDIVDIDNEKGKVRLTWQDWNVTDLSRIVNKWQRAMTEHDGWNSVFIENHDNPRSVSRYTDDSDGFRTRGAKLLSLLQTTLSGTLFVYQGEELGMRNVPRSWDPAVDYKDIEAINFWKKSKALYAHDPEKLAFQKTILQRKARDHARTPVQWNSNPNAGFCDEGVTPWMRVNDDYRTVNAERQIAPESDGEEMSVFHFWQRGLANRKAHAKSLIYGYFQLVEPQHQAVFAYLRTEKEQGEEGGEKWLVALNFSGEKVEWDIPAHVEVQSWVAGNYSNGKLDIGRMGKVQLRPWEGILGACKLVKETISKHV